MGSTAGLRSSDADLETGRVEVAKCRPDGRFWFSGWEIPTGAVRAGLTKLYGPDSHKAGFSQEIEISDLPPPDVTRQGWAVDWEAQQAFAMGGGVRFDRPVP